MANKGNTGEIYSNSLLINMDKYSIIIPVVYKDYSFLNKSIKYILEYFSPVMVYIITDSRMAKYLPKRVKSCDLCQVVDENHIVEGLSLARIDSIIKVLGRHHTKSGWYYQQFLKMGFAMSRYCETDYYLSWDSDTIPLKEFVFFDNDNHPYFTMKSEYHKPYFDTMQRVLSIGKANPCSYIAEHMMFNKQIMEEMITKIDSSNVNGKQQTATNNTTNNNQNNPQKGQSNVIKYNFKESRNYVMNYCNGLLTSIFDRYKDYMALCRSLVPENQNNNAQ